MKRRPLGVLLLCCWLGVAVSAALAVDSASSPQAEPYPIERYLNIRSAGSPSLSPDGRELVFTSAITGVGQVWRVPSSGGWPEQLSFYGDRVLGATYSPAGDWIAFSKDRGGDERAQIFLMSAEGSQIRQATDDPKAIFQFGGWSRDGKMFAYSSNQRDQRFFDVFVYDVATGQAKKVYERDESNAARGFSPHGRSLLIERSNTNLDSDLFLLDLSTDQVKHLTPHKGEAGWSEMSWLPDSSGFYVLTDLDSDFTNLAFIDVKKGELKIADRRNWDFEELGVSQDGKWMAYGLNVEGYSELHLKNLATGEEWKRPGLPKGIISALQFSRDGKYLVFTLNGSRIAQDVWMTEVESGRAWQVTRSSLGGIPPSTLVEPELIHYKTFDGREIPAFFYLPHAARKDGTLPVIVSIHGGPEAQYRPTMNPVNQYFLSRGYAVLAPNVRGSTGYGKPYTHLDDVEKRLDAVRDAAFAAAWLKLSGYVNPKKIIAMGGSYGGYMTLASLTFHSEIWAAGVDIVGVANFHSFLKNTGAWRVRFRAAEYGDPERDAKLLSEISPLNHADKIRAPLFVIAGANDPRVPKTESDQIVDAVRKKNGVVEYLLFPDEGHGLVKLPNRIRGYSRLADFLDKHVKEATRP